MSDPLMIVLIAMTWLAMLWMYRRLVDDRSSAIPEAASATVEAQHVEIVRLTEELQLAAGELGDALAKRTERLDQVMEQADRRAATLEALLDRAATITAATMVHDTPPRTQVAAPAAAVPPAEPAHAPVAEVVHAPSNQVAPETQTETPPETPRATGRAGNDEVRRLAAQGIDADTIARLTNRGREEVRLLLERAQSATGPTSHTSQSRPGSLSGAGRTA